MDPENDATNQGAADDAVHVNAEAGVDTNDQHQPELQDGQDPDQTGNPDELTAEELAEIEYEGQKYKVPPALKDAVLRQADYTRKTQEVAEQRKALEARQAEIVQQAEQQREFLKEYARVEQVEGRIERLSAERDAHLKTVNELRSLASQRNKIDWPQWYAINPEQAARDEEALARYDAAHTALQNFSVDMMGLEHERNSLKSEIEAKRNEWVSKARAEHANALEKAHAELARDLKDDWTPEGQRKLIEYGQSFGFSAEELEGVTDPRAIKLLHAAWKATRQAQTAAARATLQAQQAAKPVPQVGGSAPAGKDPSRMSTAEWMRWREQQTSSRKGR